MTRYGEFVLSHGHFLMAYLLFDKILNLMWQKYAIGQIFIVFKGNDCKQNVAISSHYLVLTNVIIILRDLPTYVWAAIT